MTLRLSIMNSNQPTLENGSPTEISLDRQGALIGRSASCDWSLPDPRNYISSRHCEIRYENGAYLLTDISMNGTFFNDQPERITQARRLADGDVLTMGHYRIRVILQQESPGSNAWAAPQSPAPSWGAPESPPMTPSSPAQPNDSWGAAPPSEPSGWDASPSAQPSGWDAPASPQPSGWDAPPASASGGWGTPSPASYSGTGNDSWASTSEDPRAAPSSVSAWDSAVPQQKPASDWSSAVPDRPVPPSPDDIWGRLAEGNVVDWARGGFGQPIVENPDPLGLAPPPTHALGTPARPFNDPNPWANSAPRPVAAPVADMHFAVPPRDANTAVPPPAAPPARTAPPPPPPASQPQAAYPPPSQQPPAFPEGDALIAAFLRAAGVDTTVPQRDPSLLDRAGKILHRLVAGLVVMVEARARAKSQMGAQTTAFEVNGNNPLKFARTPEEAIAALLNPPARGFVDADVAIEDAYFDLQSHQIATLRAMQGALRTTLDRFSPQAIRQRAERRGLLARILPSARDAALWQAYEKEFGSVAQASDEAFMDMFAKEFRRAYDEQSREQKGQR